MISNIIRLITSFLLLSGLVTLFTINFTDPKVLRWLTVPCQVSFWWKSKCDEPNCVIYDYGLRHKTNVKTIEGAFQHKCYNDVGCWLPETGECEIIQPKYANSFLVLLFDNSFASSNFLNMICFAIGSIICLSWLIFEISKLIQLNDWTCLIIGGDGGCAPTCCKFMQYRSII